MNVCFKRLFTVGTVWPRFSFFLMIFLLYTFTVAAQEEDKLSITLPSPNNVFASSLTSTNVSLYNGTPDIGLPLYSLKSSELSIPISLSYKANGVRLQDVASYVGLNWSLQAGGMITRVVRGFPDESEKGYIGKNKTGVEINTGEDNNQARADKIAAGTLDGEPDLFYIVTPTGSYSFVFDQNGVPVFNEPTRVKVSFRHDGSADDNLNIVWDMEDASGMRYTFGATANARETVDGTPEFISTWYLTNIFSFNMTDNITLDYISGDNIVTKIYNKVKIKFATSGTCSGPAEIISVSDNSRTYKAPKYISTITSKLGKVKFTYSSDRKDLTGGKQLIGIGIYNLTDMQPIRNYILSYDYFHSVSTNADLNRLYLKNIYMVSEAGRESTRLYDLKYYVDDALRFPARNSVAFDHLGYYNDNSESTPFVPEANKESNLNKTLQYTLQSIATAQGGKTEYQYELNTYYDITNNIDKVSGGLRIRAIKEYDNTGNVYTRTYEYKTESNTSSGEVLLKNLQYYKGTTLVVVPCTIRGESTNAGILFNMGDLNGSFTGYSRVKVTNPDGSYQISKFSNYSSAPDNFRIFNSNSGAQLDISAIRQFGYPTSYAYKRGLLLFKGDYMTSGNPVSETTYEYTELNAEQKKARGVSLSLSFRLAGSDLVYWYQNIYYQSTQVYKVTKETERIYDVERPSYSIFKTKNYQYNEDGTLIRRVTVNNSDGISTYDKYYYPENMGELSTPAAEMNAYNFMKLLNTPIRVDHQFSDDLTMNYTQYELQGRQSPSIIRVFPIKTFTGINGVLTQESATTYDFLTGTPVVQSLRDGNVNAFLWNTDGSLAAKTEHASSGETYFQSFEETSNAVSGIAFSGKKYYNSSYTIPFTRPNTKSYELSYRRLVNGVWELVVTPYTIDNMVLNLPYAIDDIRIYPSDARMSSYTYTPMIGITSANDANNNIQYFEYDYFQRLQRMRDLNGNILKEMSYKFACDCPLPVPNAKIVFRNAHTEIIDDGNKYIRELYSDVYIVLSESHPGISVNYRRTTLANTGNTTADSQANFSGTEILISSGLQSRYVYNTPGGTGTPVTYTDTNYSLLPGTGYTL